MSAEIRYLLRWGRTERHLMADLNRCLEGKGAAMVASGRLHALPADDPLSLFDLPASLLCPPGALAADGYYSGATHRITQVGADWREFRDREAGSCLLPSGTLWWLAHAGETSRLHARVQAIPGSCAQSLLEPTVR